MPKFTSLKPPSPEAAAAPPRSEPLGLEAFAAKTGVTPPPDIDRRPSRGRILPTSPMPVRFPPDVKAALEHLSAEDQRSQQQILERIAFPAILAAARQLGRR
jgi:hypothetical protein